MKREEQQPSLHIPETPDELISSARDYFASDFPNPERRGCPRQAEIEKSIKLRELPDDELRAHLLACSDCFVLYRQLLDVHRELPLVPLRRRFVDWVWQRRVFILAPSLVALLLIAIVALYVKTRSPQNSSSSAQHSTSAGSINLSTTVTPTPAPAVARDNSVQEPVHVARVDLRDYTLRRGAGEQEQSPLHVSARQTLFAITLPKGSPAGAYSVLLLDAFGKTVRTRSAQSSDGDKLSTTLNLQNLTEKKYRLCVVRMDEPPICYPILITEGK